MFQMNDFSRILWVVCAPGVACLVVEAEDRWGKERRDVRKRLCHFIVISV